MRNVSTINISAGGSEGNSWGIENELELERKKQREESIKNMLRIKLGCVRRGSNTRKPFEWWRGCKNKRREKGLFGML